MALHVYVDDVDATFAKALRVGASTLRPVEDKFYGDRSGEFSDPFGHRWASVTSVDGSGAAVDLGGAIRDRIRSRGRWVHRCQARRSRPPITRGLRGG